MDDVSNFCDITGAQPAVARHALEMAGGVLEMAIQLFFDNPEIANFSSATATAASEPPRPGRQLGRVHSEGIVHLDSDDDGVTEDYDFYEDGDVQLTARNAQEEEDAAMAKRMQEELYSQAGGLDDGVRSPIATRTETLVGGDDWDDGNLVGQHTASLVDRMRRQHVGVRHSPFNQSIWTDPTQLAPGNVPAPFTPDALAEIVNPPLPPGAVPSRTNQRLAELFRPPFDLMAVLDWDDARSDGKEHKKWLLVNLQDMSDFNCQTLNRDIWKNDAVRRLVLENFIFLQYPKDDMHAQQYISLYLQSNQHENPNIYPHVAIIDPRTGEMVKVWSGRPFPSAADFHDQLLDFLGRYSLVSGIKNPVVTEVKRARTVDVDRMTEEEMLEMALQNSLEASNRGGPVASDSKSGAIPDPDELTKPRSATDSPSSPAQLSSFDRISSTNPHTEPENDPATTTRIQFRHASGRVIRRFRLDDQVRRIYEWLKAEPIEGTQPGVEFELKTMPQGQDLIHGVDKTIGDAGLKQGTVMIEYITEE